MAWRAGGDSGRTETPVLYRDGRVYIAREGYAHLMLAESGVLSLSADRFDTDPGELGYVIPTAVDPEFRA